MSIAEISLYYCCYVVILTACTSPFNCSKSHQTLKSLLDIGRLNVQTSQCYAYCKA